MYRLKLLVYLLFICLTLASCESPAPEKDSIDGKVVAISDGDTFTLLNENKPTRIRLYGVDCPEKAQDYGQVAKQKLSDLIFNKQVHTIKKDIDRYGRTVALVYDAQNNCINEEMLKAGLAWHYTKYDSNPAWRRMEEEAREDHLGLWSASSPTPPWRWRRK